MNEVDKAKNQTKSRVRAKVEIGLSEAGLLYKIRPVDLGRGEQRDEPHLALNPATGNE